MRWTGLLLTLLVAAPAMAAEKIVIRSEADLPPVRFAFVAPPSGVMFGPELIAMLPTIRREAERVLADYQIDDADIRANLLLGLAAVAGLGGRPGDVGTLIAADRAAEAKPQRKLLAGFNSEVSATIAAAASGTGARCAAGARLIDQRLDDANSSVVRDTVVQGYAFSQTLSPAFAQGIVTTLFDPTVAKRGTLNIVQSLQIVQLRFSTEQLVPCRTALAAAYRRWLDAPANAAVDIWPARQPDAAALADARPVVVAVWDNGIDTTLFSGQLAGAALWNHRLEPRMSVLMPPTRFLQQRLAAQTAFDKGELDLGAGRATIEAGLFAEFSRSAAAVEQADEFAGQRENGIRTHGTACASEIADGAPYVRLFNVAALPWAFGEDKLEVAYDEPVVARWAASIRAIGPKLQVAKVRVVSMSWGFTVDEIVEDLLIHGLETDEARAKSRAQTMQGQIRSALHDLMRASPDILFVVAAGNANQSDASQASTPQDLGSSNEIVVGATGTSGHPTGFTVFGAGVPIYAQGQAVKLRWPGDITVYESGTSMATPLVARAAAQMLSQQPALTATQVRAGLLATATVSGEGLALLHPAAAVRWAKEQ